MEEVPPPRTWQAQGAGLQSLWPMVLPLRLTQTKAWP